MLNPVEGCESPLRLGGVAFFNSLLISARVLSVASLAYHEPVAHREISIRPCEMMI